MSSHSKLRVKFEKTGPIRYIGHLDVMRFFQKCIRRARIDVSYTGGFSPHQIMSFAAPLSVGLESLGEYMDIEVNSVTDSRDMVNRFNRASVPGIRIVSVKRLPENAQNAMASVAAASYIVTLREDCAPLLKPVLTEESIQEFLSLPEIRYTKEGKKGAREIDLREGIFSLSWDAGADAFHMLLDASSGGNIKPGQVLDAFFARRGIALPENALHILRQDLYTKIGGDGERRLVSMDEIGEIIREEKWTEN